MNVCLKTDIEFQVKGEVVRFKCGDLIKVDVKEGIAYYAPSDFYFDIDSKEFSYLN